MTRCRIVVHVVLCVLTLSTSRPLVAQDAAPAAVDEVRNTALAERLAIAAQETLRATNAGEPGWRAGASLLRAATRLAPAEPRFARLLAEALGRIGEDAATVEALTAYRKLAPTDQVAQIEQIDLFLNGMETSDAKLSYLTAVSGSEEVSAPVRSHAALRRAQILGERSQAQASDEALADALKLDPLNLAALELSHNRLPADAPPQKRVAGLLAMLRSNPAQGQLASILARELASVGLVKASLQWYGTAFGLYQSTGSAPAAEEVVDYAAEAYIGGEAKLAEGLLSQLLDAYPENVEAWFLRLIVARSSGDKEATEKVRKQTATALANRLALIRQAAGETGATTQPLDPPADAQWPDPAATLEKVRAANKPELTEALAATALSTAWFKTYFEEKPDDAQPWIGVMRTLLVEGSQTVARLEGWTFLLQNRPDEARVKLSAVAETDPLAALGLIRLAGNEPDAKAAADAEAKTLLAKHGHGLTGATLAEAFAFRGVKPSASEAAEPVTIELAKFPGGFLRILDYPGAFYLLRVDPVRISHTFGEPILLKVTIQNVSEYDLTIGADGIVRSDLWIDGQLRGIANQAFPGVAFDRLAGPVVLPAKKAMSQVVRASQGALAEYLAANPTASVQLSFTVTTNPTTAGADGTVAPGAGGQKTTTGRLVERRGTPNNAAALEQRALGALNNGQPPDKVAALELVATFVRMIEEKPGENQTPEETKNASAALRDLIRRGTADPDEGVRAWAMYVNVTMLPPAERAAAIDALLADQSWIGRLLGVLASQKTADGREAVAKLAESEADEVVKQYAAAVAAMPATTQPTTTQATTAPAQ